MIKSWISHLLVVSLILGLLSLHMGFGLILGIGLIIYAQYLAEKTTLYSTPKWSKSMAIAIFSGSLFFFLFLLHQGFILAISTIRSEGPALVQYIQENISTLGNQYPILKEYIPNDNTALAAFGKKMLSFMQGNIVTVGGIGMSLFFQLLFAIIIAFSFIKTSKSENSPTPFMTDLQDSMSSFLELFKRLMGAQIYVACWNAFCTSVFVYMLLPLLFDVILPYRGGLVFITLCISIIPAIGNIVGNSLMATMCLPHGFMILMVALIFLILAHKAEYLINAKIIGKHVQSRLPEMLLALLIGEKLFGLSGLMLGPILYAHTKLFLMRHKYI